MQERWLVLGRKPGSEVWEKSGWWRGWLEKRAADGSGNEGQKTIKMHIGEGEETNQSGVI